MDWHSRVHSTSIGGLLATCIETWIFAAKDFSRAARAWQAAAERHGRHDSTPGKGREGAPPEEPKAPTRLSLDPQDVVALEREPNPPPATGVWLAFYFDKSGFQIYASEIEALRAAAERTQEVKFARWGEYPFAENTPLEEDDIEARRRFL